MLTISPCSANVQMLYFIFEHEHLTPKQIGDMQMSYQQFLLRENNMFYIIYVSMTLILAMKLCDTN